MILAYTLNKQNIIILKDENCTSVLSSIKYDKKFYKKQFNIICLQMPKRRKQLFMDLINHIMNMKKAAAIETPLIRKNTRNPLKFKTLCEGSESFDPGLSHLFSGQQY